jgi:hypothetical protein
MNNILGSCLAIESWIRLFGVLLKLKLIKVNYLKKNISKWFKFRCLTNFKLKLLRIVIFASLIHCTLCLACVIILHYCFLLHLQMCVFPRAFALLPPLLVVKLIMVSYICIVFHGQQFQNKVWTTSRDI